MANANNITLRSEKGSFITYEDMDLNLLELQNLIIEYNSFIDSTYANHVSDFNDLQTAYDTFVTAVNSTFDTIDQQIVGLDDEQLIQDQRLTDAESTIFTLSVRGMLTPKGTYVAGTYNLGDVVTYTDGLSYVSAANNNLQEPLLGQSNSYWVTLTSKSIAAYVAYSNPDLSAQNVKSALDEIVAKPISDFKAPVYESKNSPFTALSGGWYGLDTTNALSVTLTATPASGDMIEFFITNGDPTVNNITLLRNGNLIEDVAQDLIIDSIQPRSFKLLFNGTSWLVSR